MREVSEVRTEEEEEEERVAEDVFVDPVIREHYAAALDTLRVLSLEAKVEELNEMHKKKEHKDNAENT